MNMAHAQAISEAMKRAHARKRQIVTTYEQALKKIARMPTAGIRAKNVAVKALNGDHR